MQRKAYRRYRSNKNCLKKRVQKMERKSYPILDLKQENDDDFYLSGYANVKNVVDSHNDICIGENVYDLKRYKKNPIALIDHDHTSKSILGSMVEIEEDKKGLRFKFKAMRNPKNKDVQHGIEAIKEGHLRTLSIGGKWEYAEEKTKNGHNILTKAEIFEISFVTIPSNNESLTEIPKVKNLESNQEDSEEKEHAEKLNIKIGKLINFLTLSKNLKKQRGQKNGATIKNRRKTR